MNADRDSSPPGSPGQTGERAQASEATHGQRRALVGALLAWPMRSRAPRAAALGGLMSSAASGFASSGSTTTGSSTTQRASTASAATGSATATRADSPAASYDEAILRFTGGTRPGSGKVKLDVALLIDNGNTVPVSVSVDHPMNDDDHVQAIAIFSERNPQHEVLRVDLTPANGRASVASRIRLATSQKLMAVARLSDGSYWSHEMEVIVTLAACIEGEP